MILSLDSSMNGSSFAVLFVPHVTFFLLFKTFCYKICYWVVLSPFALSTLFNWCHILVSYISMRKVHYSSYHLIFASCQKCHKNNSLGSYDWNTSFLWMIFCYSVVIGHRFLKYVQLVCLSLGYTIFRDDLLITPVSGDDPNQVLERAKYIYIILHVLLVQHMYFVWLSFLPSPWGTK